MKKIFFVLAMLIGIAYGQTTAYLRYDSVKLAKNGGTTELILENATKATTGGVLVNTGNGRTAFSAAGGSWTPTWQQTLTAGSTLTTNNTAIHSGYIFQMYAENGSKQQLIKSATDSTLGMYLRNSSSNDLAYFSITGADTSATIKGGRQTHGSGITLKDAGIYNTPYLGLYYIDTLTNNVGTKAIRYNPVTGLISYADTTSSGSGSTNTSLGSGYKIAVDGTNDIKSLGQGWGVILDSATSGQVGVKVDTAAGKVATKSDLSGYANVALSNLSSVAINTSLLPGTSASINLGSISKNWKNLYLSGTSSSTDGIIYRNGETFIHNYQASGTDGDNTFIGTGSGSYFNLSGSGVNASYNLGVGTATLRANTTGSRNTAVGTYAMQNNTTGVNNTVVGQNALATNTTGYNNAVLGVRAAAFGSPHDIAAVGVDAASRTNNATYISALGTDAYYNAYNSLYGVAIGDSTLWKDSTGIKNTAVGSRAGYYLGDTYPNFSTQKDNYMTFLGADASRDSSVYHQTGLSNSTAIGYNAKVSASNQVVIGNDNVTTTLLKGSVGIGTSSPDSLLTVEQGIWGKRGVRFSGLPSGVGTKAVRIDANGVLSIADTTAGGGLTIGSTTITSGTNTKVLYNNSGVVGEYTVSGSGNVAMTTSPVFTTPDLGTPSALVGTNITGTAASLTAGNATTLATSRNLNNAAFNGSANVLVPDQNPSIMALLGGAILAEPVTGDVFKTASSSNLTDGQVRWVAIYIPAAITITGIKWMQQTQGSYTADNYNGVGLYSYSGGNLTLVASSTDDGNIWKATSFTWSSKAFSSTYAASAGIYFAALIYNSSAQTTAPALRANQLSSDLLNTVDFTNSAKFGASLTGQTGFPAGPSAMSTLTTNSAIPYLALY